jgi:hypothetical protein
MCRWGLNPLKDVQGRESISLCHGHDLGHLSTDLNHTDTWTVSMIASAVLIVLLMTGAERTRNM